METKLKNHIIYLYRNSMKNSVFLRLLVIYIEIKIHYEKKMEIEKFKNCCQELIYKRK